MQLFEPTQASQASPVHHSIRIAKEDIILVTSSESGTNYERLKVPERPRQLPMLDPMVSAYWFNFYICVCSLVLSRWPQHYELGCHHMQSVGR